MTYHSSGAPPALLKRVLGIVRASAASAKAPEFESADMSFSSRQADDGSWRASGEGSGTGIASIDSTRSSCTVRPGTAAAPCSRSSMPPHGLCSAAVVKLEGDAGEERQKSEAVGNSNKQGFLA